MNKLLTIAATLAFSAGTLALSAQSTPPQSPNDPQQPTASQPQATPESATPQTATPQNDMQNAASKPFSGTIVKEKGKLVLKDSATNVSYKLDDQDKAKEFEGKQVKVTGKLDATSNQIHVENIEAAM
jgi:uncharacterized protein YdeI (BOF family)